MNSEFGIGYSYLCPCGTLLQTENGLDYNDQLMFLKARVDHHRKEHRERTLESLPGYVPAEADDAAPLR